MTTNSTNRTLMNSSNDPSYHQSVQHIERYYSSLINFIPKKFFKQFTSMIFKPKDFQGWSKRRVLFYRISTPFHCLYENFSPTWYFVAWLWFVSSFMLWVLSYLSVNFILGVRQAPSTIEPTLFQYVFFWII
jgi:hypothetical protein